MRRLAILATMLLLTGCMAPVDAGHPLRFPIYFQELSARLDDTGVNVVTEAAKYAAAHADAPVTVIGFADPDGSKQANIDISRTRAQVVSDALVAAGVPAGRIRRDALGATPFAFSSIESRRVEIDVLAN